MTGPQAPVLAEVLREGRRSLLLWAVAVAAVAGLYTAAFRAIGSAKQDVVAGLPHGLVTALDLGSLSSPGGYLGSTVYGILGPALLLVHGVSRGGRLLAGQEEDGTLELELSLPVSRRRVYVERLLGLWAGVLALAGVLTAAVLVVGRLAAVHVGVARVLAGSAGLALLVLAMSTVAYAVGATTGRRAPALAAGAGLALVAYVAQALGALAGARWLQDVSPWSWYLGRSPLSRGFDVAGLAELALLLAAAAALGVPRWNRRDLGV